MAATTWNLSQVRTFLGTHGSDFARCREPRGLKATMIRDWNERLMGHCFVNNLRLSASTDKVWYCEGFATNPSDFTKITPHAWVTYRDCPVWAIDVTWPWRHRGKLLEGCMYRGIMVDGKKAVDWLKQRGGDTRTTLLKYVDELPLELLVPHA